MIAKDLINGKWVEVVSIWGDVVVVKRGGDVYFRFVSQLE